MEVTQSNLETLYESQSKYYQRLRDVFGAKEVYNHNLKLLLELLKKENIPADSMGIFMLHKRYGRIYIEFAKTCCRTLNEAITTFKNHIRKGDGKKFKNGELKTTLTKLYENTIKADPSLNLVLEIGIRKFLLPHLIQEDKKTRRIFHSAFRTLLEDIRGGLKSKYKLHLSLCELMQKAPIKEFSGLAEFKDEALEHSVPGSLLEAIHNLLKTTFLKKTEELHPSEIRVTSLKDLSEIRIAGDSYKQVYKHARRQFETLLFSYKKELKEIEIVDNKVKKETRSIFNEKINELQSFTKKKLSAKELKNITERTGEILKEIQRTLYSHLWHISECERKRSEVSEEIEKIKKIRNPEDLQELIKREEKDDIVNRILEYYTLRSVASDKLPNKLKKELARMLYEKEKEMRKTKTAGNDKELEILQRLRVKSGYDVDLLINNYFHLFEEVIKPSIFMKKLSEMVKIWMPEADKSLAPYREKELCDVANFIGGDLIPNQLFYRFSFEGNIKPKLNIMVKEREKIEDMLRKMNLKTITVFTYDIRGSTFMGSKLQNAAKERMIKNKFNQEMAKIAKRYGSFLVKDTGDGGIIFFAENSKELYNITYKEVHTSDGIKLRYSFTPGTKISLSPSTTSGLKALLCASEMVKGAKKFVKDNFIYYRDWFKEAKEMELLHEGVTYALLPPEFKSLFRIGIGVTSGRLNRDIIFGLNAFGDPDLIGPLANEASLLSGGRDPMRSTILTDGNTVFNLILNAKRFNISFEEKENIEKDIRKILNKKITETAQSKNQERTYIFDGLGFKVRRIGRYNLIEEDKRNAPIFDCSDFDFNIDEEGEFCDSNNIPFKFIYEVEPLKL